MKSYRLNKQTDKYLIWLYLICYLFLTDNYYLFIEATCRSPIGDPKCCIGKKPNCYGYSENDGSKSMTDYRYVITNKTCFCDEHCVVTNDCCPDYHELCDPRTVDCEVNEWGPWTSCSQPCGQGWKVRRRSILKRPGLGGKRCPTLEERRSCYNYKCPPRRVGRSDTLMIPYIPHVKNEVAHLLPVRGDVLGWTRLYDMRWDVRRKLYLGRLIKMNKTEEPEPDPYCTIYEITQVNAACEMQNLLWQLNRESRSYPQHKYRSFRHNKRQAVTFSRSTYWNSAVNNPLYNYAGQSGFTKKHADDTETHAWLTHVSLLRTGQQICVTCYPVYMREDLGYRCTGSGLLNIETRWRALRTSDCQGRFKMISMPQRSCTCGRSAASFVFV